MYVTKEIQNLLEKRKRDVHQRSIFREMMNTCEKFQNSFLTKEQLRQFSEKEKLQNLQTAHSSKNSRQRTFRKTHCPSQSSTQRNIPLPQPIVYVKESQEVKQIKILRQKMIPKVNKTNLQKKFKEIAYIRNLGYKTKNKKLQAFKTLTIEKDEDNIINRSWNQFYKDKKFLTPTQTPKLFPHYELFPVQETTVELDRKKHQKRKITKKPTYYLSVKNSPLKCKTSIESSLNTTALTPLDTTIASPINTTISANFSVQHQSNPHETSVCHVLATNNENKLDDLTILDFNRKDQNNQNPVRTAIRNKTVFKDTILNLSRANHNSKSTPITKRQTLSYDRKKEITQKIGLTKEKLMKENAFSLYKLVKGGYIADTNDPEGQHISLKRFRETKKNFMILNTCFKKIKQQRYLVQQPESVFNDGSFRSLVYLTEVENKIPQALFKRVQLLNNVVN